MFHCYDKMIVQILFATICVLNGKQTITIVESFTFKVLPQHQQRIYHHEEQQKFQTLPSVHIHTKKNHRNVVLAVQVNGENQIISPFDISAQQQQSSDDGNISTATTTTTTDSSTSTSASNEILDLTWENVELVLDGMRHYLIQDGGNVIIDDIDGPIVKLQLQGACGTCPSSTQTMKMGYVFLIFNFLFEFVLFCFEML
jgi:Fe-S cluster biogenesis protein NfuA